LTSLTLFFIIYIQILHSSSRGAGPSSSCSAGHSSSIEEPELRRIREELIEKYSSKSIEYFYKYYKPTRSQVNWFYKICICHHPIRF